MVLYDLYETEFGICNHINGSTKSRPLASVALHPSENINDGGLLEEAVRTYTSRGIKDIYGLTLIDFLELPRDIIEMLVTIADEIQTKKSSIISNIEKELK